MGQQNPTITTPVRPKLPLEWEQEFLVNIKPYPAGRPAWKELSDAGLGDAARVILYWIYAYGKSVPAAFSKQLGELNARFDALRRAGVQANLHFPGIGMVPVSKAPAVIGDARQFIERAEGKLGLALLRIGAQAHGVKLSLMALAELWLAAAPDRDSDPLTLKYVLQRFLNLDATKQAEPGYLDFSESLLQGLRATLREAAAALGVSKACVHRWVLNRWISGYRDPHWRGRGYSNPAGGVCAGKGAAIRAVTDAEATRGSIFVASENSRSGGQEQCKR